MVVTGGILRAIQYYHAIRQYLLARKSPYQAIVAFSGEHEYGGVKVSEASRPTDGAATASCASSRHRSP